MELVRMSYPNIDSPAPGAKPDAKPDAKPEASKAAPAAETPQQRLARRMREIQMEIVEACGRLVEQIGRPDETHALAIADRRRQFANMLHASTFCHRAACRRVHSCQGEPTRCLSVLLPALGFDRAAQALLRLKKPKRANRARASR
jgi:hypothetical protein